MANKVRKSLIAKLISSFAIAIALLFIAVLPAEFGNDPTGLGAKMGLVALASETTEATTQPYDSVLEFNVEEYDTNAEQIERSIKGLVTLEDAPFKSETITIVVEDLGEVEYKFIMREGMNFVYAWEVEEVKGDGVYFDFHGHPQASDVENYPEDFEMAYSRSEGASQSGAFRAPFGGLHGFYFMNLEEGSITIKLTVSGYFNDHKEVYRAVDGKILTQIEL